MKSLIHSWTKKSKGKGKGSAGGSDQGSRETSSESARSGQKKPSDDSTPTQIHPGMGAKDFGKVSTHPDALPCMLEPFFLIAQQTPNLLPKLAISCLPHLHSFHKCEHAPICH